MNGFGNGSRNTALALGAVCFFLLFAAQAKAIARPTLASPTNGATVATLPVFGWNPVRGADRYQFEVATDASFNSPIRVDGRDYVTTRNTRATLKKSVPNGKVYWRVRAVSASGTPSNWSPARWVTKSWLAAPTLLSPADDANLSFPAEPLRLVWSAVPRAAHYRVTLATDAALANALVDDAKTAATAATPDGVLPRGDYFWAVTPIDAQGNRGQRSPIQTFRYTWPSTVVPSVSDLLPAIDEVFDPQFSWALIPGAARYDVEVNPSSDFAQGSKVCCNAATIGSALSPKTVLENNTYYWRVRAVDAAGNAGPWTEGTPFQKTFDSPPDTPLPTVKNLRMRDNDSDPGTDTDSGALGYQTAVPVVTWDHVPGASSYKVEVAPWGVSDCNWTATSSHWNVTTASTSWTPLGTGWNGQKPYTSNTSVSTDQPTMALVIGQKYCVRIRAQTDRAAGNNDVLGLETVLDDDTGSGFAFEFTGPYAASGDCNPSDPAYPGASDYLEPQRGQVKGFAPLFTWEPIPDANSYFVLVSKDEAFSTVVDYAFVKLPVYAPRKGTLPHTYTDELTSYYWSVLPAACGNGNRARGTPSLSNYADFEKRSTPPTLVAPIEGAQIAGQPVFRWTSVLGARRYRLQVSVDPSFATIEHEAVTNSTAYTAETTLEADTVLYWRVRAEDEKLVGLTWSARETFKRVLPKPVPSAGNPVSGGYIPTWTWAPITGAVSYDIQVDLPDSTQPRTFTDLKTAAFAAARMTGIGVFTWRVRANFPGTTQFEAPTHGPWSTSRDFTRTIPEPTGAAASSSPGRLVLSWSPRLYAKNYRLQVSSSKDFSSIVESTTTDETSYAPTMMTSAYGAGGKLWWRVAAMDEDGNVGAFTTPRSFTQPKGMTVSASGYLRRRERTTVTVRIYDSNHNPVRYAAVRGVGAGVRTSRKRTRADGSITFSIRPTRLGTVTFTVTKSGYRPGEDTLTVR